MEYKIAALTKEEEEKLKEIEKEMNVVLVAYTEAKKEEEDIAKR